MHLSFWITRSIITDVHYILNRRLEETNTVLHILLLLIIIINYRFLILYYLFMSVASFLIALYHNLMAYLIL
jgi:hypothetical protein